MNNPVHQSGTITSSALVILPLMLGEAYSLVLGLEGDDFNAETITPKLFTGINGGVAAAGTLTVDTQPTAGDTLTIDERVYTFIGETAAKTKADANTAQIRLGATLAATKLAIVAAINGSGDKDMADRAVTAAAFSGDDCVLTAISVGTIGNAIATTETFTAVGNVFDAATLGTTTAGTDVVTGQVSALPTPGSADSAGSPQAFAAAGMIEFTAGLPSLVLVPSGAVTSVKYRLIKINAYRGLTISR